MADEKTADETQSNARFVLEQRLPRKVEWRLTYLVNKVAWWVVDKLAKKKIKNDAALKLFLRVIQKIISNFNKSEMYSSESCLRI